MVSTGRWSDGKLESWRTSVVWAASEEGVVQGTHEALRAHPRGGLCKGVQAAQP